MSGAWLLSLWSVLGWFVVDGQVLSIYPCCICRWRAMWEAKGHDI